MRMSIHIALALLMLPVAANAQPWFRDATKEYGPIGGGPAAFADVDGDGFPDLVCDGRIYKNDAGKRFIDVTKDSGVSGSGTACIADIDNDGKPDIYFSGGPGRLYRNLGNFKFADWTKKVPPNKHARSLAAAFGDLDGDGHVDLYVTNYEDWKDNTYPYPDLLFKNRGGDKGFEPWWEAKNKEHIMAGRGVTFFDVDGDGKPEIYVSNYRLGPNFLWFFDKKNILRDRAVELGAAGKLGPNVRYGNGAVVRCCGHTIGSCIADFDNDTHLDILVANFSHPPAYQNRTQFLRNLPPSPLAGEGKGVRGHKFEDKSALANLRWQESYAVAAAGDIDNDGLVDFVLTTVYPGDKSVIYRNLGGWKFADITKETGVATANTYQASFADINGDGYLDLVSGGKVWINTLGKTLKHNYVKIRLEGAGTCNKSAVGSRVIVKAGGKTFTRQVEAGTGSGCQNDLTLHFGLGSATGPADVTIHWAGGGVSTQRIDLNRTVVVRKALLPR
ncbi:MAG: CRTAC1 family protein [Planctomycetes bacterium]|nr:CRTAC1 family protein [Planctomycetota bacterium]